MRMMRSRDGEDGEDGGGDEREREIWRLKRRSCWGREETGHATYVAPASAT
jgi:hypothetical protein